MFIYTMIMNIILTYSDGSRAGICVNKNGVNVNPTEVVLNTGSYTGNAWLGARFFFEVISTLYTLGDLGSHILWQITEHIRRTFNMLVLSETKEWVNV